MQTKGRETPNMKKQLKQKAGILRAVQGRGKMLLYKNNAMQTMQLNQELFIIQQSQVTITIRLKTSFQKNIMNENQGFLSEQFREDDIQEYVKQTNQRNNNNDRETFFQTNIKKRKNKSKVDISESATHRNEHDTIDIPQGIESSDQRLNISEYSKFDGEFDDIRDQEYHHIKIIIDTSL